MRNKKNNANLSNKKRAVEKNTAPQSKKNRRKHTKKKKINIAKILKWTCLIFVIAGVIAFLFTTPIFNIKEIQVAGNEQVSTEEIQSLSQIQLDENIFRNLKSNIINNVKENAYIDNVTVKRILPDKIQIQVQERQVRFMLKLLNSYIYISSQGYLLEISETPKQVPIIEGISTPEEELTVGNRLNVQDLEALQTVLQIMSNSEENEISQFITSINIQNKNDYTIYFESKSKTAHLGDATNLDTRILYVKAILEAEEGKVGEIFVNGDLNDDFKPFFREKI